MKLQVQKLNHYLNEAIKISPGRTLSIYCWRGGMRSASLAWLLGFSGFTIRVLEGGYKAYRNYSRTCFAHPAPIILLGGYTGSGKTELLNYLKAKGEQVINLEELSHHKGSAFGWIGENSQPSQEQFVNNLADQWQKRDNTKTIWLEDESINIGKIQIPRPLFDHMEQAPVVVIETGKKTRIDRLVRDYQSGTKEDLKTVFNRINKRIGMENCRQAIEAVENNELDIAAGIALSYYDKAYWSQLKKRSGNRLHFIAYNADIDALANQLFDCRRKIIL